MKPARLSNLFYLGLLAMELSYLYILASLLGGPAYAVFLVLLTYPIALLGKLVLPRLLSPRWLRLGLELALAALVTALAALAQPEVSGIILCVSLCGLSWLLGRTVPRQRVNYPTIALRLQIGVLAVLVFSQIAGSAPPVFLFFLLVPLALFLARWVSSFSRGASVLRSPNVGHLFLGSAVVIVPGTAIVMASSPEVARAFVNWLKNVFTNLSEWVEAQNRAASEITGDFNFSCSLRPDEGGSSSSSSANLPIDAAGGGSPIVLWIMGGVILLAIVLLIIFSLRRRRKARRKKAPTAEPTPFQIRTASLSIFRSLLAFFPRLARQLWLWLKSLLRKWRRRPTPSEEALISIRALYRNLLRWASKQGLARLPWQTPLEHLALLEERFPQRQDSLKRFTEAYLAARYGRGSVSPEEFESAREAWRRAVAPN